MGFPAHRPRRAGSTLLALRSAPGVELEPALQRGRAGGNMRRHAAESGPSEAAGVGIEVDRLFAALVREREKGCRYWPLV